MLAARMPRLAVDLLRLARPYDWAKSVFVLLPVPFALRAGASLSIGTFALGVAAFSLVASGIYVLNDLRDVEADRAHPKKRLRPIASRAVPPGVAGVWGAVLLAAGLALGVATGHRAVVAYLLVYVALNAFYTLAGKRVPILDVFLIAAGFVLRVLVGCALVDAPPSNWLLTCSLWVALFLGFAKRRADFARGSGAEAGPARVGYTAAFLDQAMGIAAAVTLVSYALYSQEAAVFVKGRELAGMPFVAFGLLHYLRLAHTDQVRVGPVEMAWQSRALQLCSLGWLVATLWSLGAF
jgi:4-hydroxybenzoate polyprenyltransferase